MIPEDSKVLEGAKMVDILSGHEGVQHEVCAWVEHQGPS